VETAAPLVEQASMYVYDSEPSGHSFARIQNTEFLK